MCRSLDFSHEIKIKTFFVNIIRPVEKLISRRKLDPEFVLTFFFCIKIILSITTRAYVSNVSKKQYYIGMHPGGKTSAFQKHTLCLDQKCPYAILLH